MSVVTEGAAVSPADNKPVLVQIDRVSKLFGDVRAVDDVSLTINKGEIFSLLGGSGSGKSTLLRMLAGFEKPSSGRIFLDGEDITDVPPYDRPINMMFQSYALFPHMTVAQNIAFGSSRTNCPKQKSNPGWMRCCGWSRWKPTPSVNHTSFLVASVSV